MPQRGRLPARAQDLAVRAAQSLAGRRLRAEDVARAIRSSHPYEIRYATLTGRLLIQWDGARQPIIWTVGAPTMTPADALKDLSRRFLHVFGPSSLSSFVRWGGLDTVPATSAFAALSPELLTVRTPLGEALMLAEDEPIARKRPAATDAARLLPSGDPYYLWWGADRQLLVSNRRHRAELWTSRVWPGALLLGGEIVGTWRRSKAVVTVTPWRRLTTAERATVESEAAMLPLPEAATPATVKWDDGA
jgi:hypothetical protein